jgi:hypothetical protein
MRRQCAGVREFADHADIRTTEVYFVRTGEERGGGAPPPDPADRSQWPVNPCEKFYFFLQRSGIDYL